MMPVLWEKPILYKYSQSILEMWILRKIPEVTIETATAPSAWI